MKKTLDIALIEPFYTGSHKQWVDGFKQHSQHNIHVFSLPGRHWKWRMQHSAITLAEQVKSSAIQFDLFLVTDFLNLALFKSLLPAYVDIPCAVYFHENQLSYPWSPTDPDVSLKRDLSYGFINYSSALVADSIFFNSEYHQQSFLEALSKFLVRFPDYQNIENIDLIKKKSSVLALGLDLSFFDSFRPESMHEKSTPALLWNHRWEYDKNPELFFESLIRLKHEDVDFDLIVLGEEKPKKPAIFDTAKVELGDHILQWGHCETREEYATWLWRADILPVTSNQDFFGASVVEAIYCQTHPLLPNRLAYPAHLHQEDQHALFSNDDSFYEKLKALCVDFKLRDPVDWQSRVTRYDWQQLIAVYDNKLSDLLIG